MSWFTEDSTPVLVIGVIVAAFLLLALVKTSRLGLLYAIAGVVLVVGAIVWIEKHTVTDTKQVRGVLSAAAAAAERNDLKGVLDLISPSASATRNLVSGQMPQVEIHSVSLNGLQIQVNRLSTPPSATAEFTGVVNGRVKSGLYPYDNIVARCRIILVLENDRWLIDSFEERRDQAVGGRE
jgi:hypothetical protein